MFIKTWIAAVKLLFYLFLKNYWTDYWDRTIFLEVLLVIIKLIGRHIDIFNFFSTIELL
jgi:hypothetical protein